MHKLARRLVETYSIIVVEDLDIRQMTLRLTPEEREQGKMKYSKSIYDAGWGLFLGLLESKAAEAGSLVIRVDPGHTTQVCSGCGTLPAVKKSLRHRVHECDCGLRLDRDINAARNILRRGLLWLQRELELGGPEGASGQQFSEPRKSDLRAAVKIALSQA
jgi:putative transposase